LLSNSVLQFADFFFILKMNVHCSASISVSILVRLV
jgi:hypothetical protein